MSSPPSIQNYERICQAMKKALHQSGRPEESAKLTAVSKTQAWDTIEPVLELGHRRFGENRVQEALERWGPVKPKYPDLSLCLIGPLQSNKAADAVKLFDIIQTIDREKIARAVANEIQSQGRTIDTYVQINIGEEPQKAGIPPKEADQFIKTLRDSFGLKVSGLMCIPPIEGPRGPYFALMAKIAKHSGIDHLSMGMSDDFETALAFGSNEIRVGTAIFGSR
jgi:PLP dependent protein